jgi:hypothetical protein
LDVVALAYWLDQIRRTIAALGHLTEEALPPDAWDSLLQAIRW